MNNFITKQKINISNFFKINPHNHWIKMLNIFFILTIILIFFSFNILYNIKNEEIFQTKEEIDTKKSLLKDELLKSTLLEFKDKEEKFIIINEKDSPYSDPSL